MNYMLETPQVWDPEAAEAALKNWLNGKFFTCSGCKARGVVGEQEDEILPEKPECTSIDNATAFDVLNAVCITYGITMTEIQGPVQSQKVAAARRHAIWFLNKECSHSVSKAGDVVSRDPRTARQAIAIAEETFAGQNARCSKTEFYEQNLKIIDLLGGKRGEARG